MTTSDPERPPIPPMSPETGDRLMILLGVTAGFLALLGFGLEEFSQRQLSERLGIFPVYLTTPLGLGAAILTVLTALRIAPKKAIFSALLSAAYWILYIIFV